MDSQAQIQEEFEDRSETLLKDFLKVGFEKSFPTLQCCSVQWGEQKDGLKREREKLKMPWRCLLNNVLGVPERRRCYLEGSLLANEIQILHDTCQSASSAD